MAATNQEELIRNASDNKEKSETCNTTFYRCPITQEDLNKGNIVLGTDGVLYSETGFKLLINHEGENPKSPLSRQPFPRLQESFMPERHPLYPSRKQVVYAPGVMDILKQSIELSTVTEMVRNAKNEELPPEYSHLPEYYYPDDEAPKQKSMQEDAELDIEEETDVSNNGNPAPQSVEASGQNNHHRYDRNRFFTPSYVESIPPFGGVLCGIPFYCLVLDCLVPKIGATLAVSCGVPACLVGTAAGACLLTIPAEIEANYQNRPMEMAEDNPLLEGEERPGFFSRLLR